MKRTIPSILGILVLVAGIVFGVVLIGQEQIFRLGASGSIAPQDVRVSNIGDTTFTVSWFTERETLGVVNWGISTSLGQPVKQTGPDTERLHSVTFERLSPATTYYFVINSAGTEFDNNGVPWTTTTGPALKTPSGTILASGTIVKADNTPADGVLVYINGGGISQLSTTTSQNGTWTIPLSSARSKILSTYAEFREAEILDVFIQGGNGITAAAQVKALQANPIPTITLGETYDFRDQSSVGVNLPEASVNLPEATDIPEGAGGLEVSEETETDSGKAVTLTSIDESGEAIFTDNPEFFGEGPAGAVITITIESEPTTRAVTVGSNGRWSFSPENNLESGDHSVTITWTDAQGFLRSLTRTFIVHAAEAGPGFESTPSGTTASPSPSPSPTPTPTVSPTTTPTSTPTPSLTPTPAPTRASIPSTESGIPTAGSLTPTFLLATIGLILFFSGIVISSRRNI